jgi:glycosyltransferase involved in cell wall biosynthesis
VRVLLVSANFRPHVGGIERFTETLAGGLAERGHEVGVLCCRFDDAPLREEVDGFTVHRIRSAYAAERLNVPWPVPEPFGLLGALRERVPGADVVHVQDAIYATSAPVLAFARRRRVPSVLTQHVAFVPQSSRLLDTVQHGALATFGRCSRLATIVATLNPAVAAWVQERWAVPNVRVLPVGISAPEPAGDRSTVRRSFGLPEDRLLALFVGRDVPKKGLDVFLGAADHGYGLVAVTDRLENTSNDEVAMLPFMSPERLQELMSCVDCFVLPSEGEGFPLSLQEALAQGLPVITTSQPGYEHYLSAEDVLYVERDPADVRAALLRLSADAELRAALGGRARAAAERHFGHDRFVSAYEELYEELYEAARSRP